MSITVSGLDELYKRFDSVAAADILEPPMQRSVLRGEAYLKHYPAAPSQSKYIRGRGKSERLGSRWTTKIDRGVNSLTGTIGNNASYARWVQSAAYQTRVHARTGWRTDEQFVRDNEAAIVADFEQAVDRAVKE